MVTALVIGTITFLVGAVLAFIIGEEANRPRVAWGFFLGLMAIGTYLCGWWFLAGIPAAIILVLLVIIGLVVIAWITARDKDEQDYDDASDGSREERGGLFAGLAAWASDDDDDDDGGSSWAGGLSEFFEGTMPDPRDDD